jgi:hypothetical protein
MDYTVAVREKGKSGPFQYIGMDLRVHDTVAYCKPLSREEAETAKRHLCDGAAKLGRPITCRIVRIAAPR